MQKTNKDGFGALFNNDKNGVEARPDFRGDLTIDGKPYRISGWKKQGPNKNYISLAATLNEDIKVD